MITLREHQNEAIDGLRAGIRAGHTRQILILPTGAGKTVIAGEIIRFAKAKGKVVLFVVDRIALADNAIDHFRDIGQTVSVIRGEDTDFIPGCDVFVASIQTLASRKRLSEGAIFIPSADILIIDEVHVLHQAHALLLEQWDQPTSGRPVLGLTATPFSRSLGQYFERLVVPTSIKKLTDQGLLVPVLPYGPSTFDVQGVKTRAGDYAAGELSRAVNIVTLRADVLKTWQRLGEGRQTLVFAVDIAHSKALNEAFLEAGVRSEHLDGHDDAGLRREIIGRFRSGETTILCSVGCLSLGFDAPVASCLVLARPTKSLTLHLQMIGRGLRTNAGKSDCLLIDHGGNIARHGLPADIQIGKLNRATKTWGSQGIKPESLPKPCVKCAFIKPAKVHKCPQCGFAPQRQHQVETIDVEIVPLTKAAQALTGKRLYQEFLGVCDALDKAPGWAYHLYLAKTGIKPEWEWKDLPATTPSPEARNYARSQLIRSAMSRRKRERQTSLQGAVTG